MIKLINSIFIFLLSTTLAFAQTAALLPNGKQTFLDNNGKPLAGGKVQFYVPGTTTNKTTWQDAGQTIPNANPVILDSAGRAQIYGNGTYQQVVRDKNDNIIWNVQTASTGSGGGGGGSPTVGDGQPVGSIQQWAGFVAPSQYVFAYGQELTRVSTPELFQAITIQQTVSCNLGSPTLSGLDTSQLPVGSPIESTCLNAGATIISKTSSTVTASANAVISSSTTARFFPWGNGDGSNTYNIPDLRGRVLPGRNNMGGIASSRLTNTYYGSNPDALGASGGNQSTQLLQSNLPNTTLTANVSGSVVSSGNNFMYGALSSGNVGTTGTPTTAYVGGYAGSTSVNSSGSMTGTTSSINGGVAQTSFSRISPSITINYVIKVTPDSNPNTFFGVASIGGMYGILNCGTGLTCAGNTLSVALGASQPGGATGSIQYNQGAGLFGGFVASGDATIDTSTGNVTVTKTGGVNFAASATTNTTNASNISSGTLNTARLPSPFTSGTASGNTNKFATMSGSIVNGNCVQADANGNLVDAGAICGSGGGGGLPSIGNGQILANTSGGTSTPVGTSGTSWFDVAFCNTVGYVVARTTGGWICSQGIPADPRWFGADNTGAVDASTVWQNMLNSGVRNIACYGTYLINTTLTLPQATAGLVNKWKIAGNCLLNTTTASTTTISYVRDNTKPEVIYEFDGVSLNNTSTGTGIKFWGVYVGGVLYNNGTLHFNNSVLTNCFRCTDLQYTSAQFRNIRGAPGTGGVTFYGTIDVSGSLFRDILILNGAYGLYLDGSAQPSAGLSNGVILDRWHSVFQSSQDISINSYDAVFIDKSGMDLGGVVGPQTCAVQFINSTHVKITNSYIASNPTAKANRVGICFTGATTYAQVMANSILNNNAAFATYNTTSYVFFSYNDLQGNTSGAVNAGTGTNLTFTPNM